MPDVGQIAAALQKLLQDSDGPVPHQVAIALLSRQLAGVSPEDYFAAVDQLSSAGLVGRARGQGGKVFLVRDTELAPSDVSSQAPQAYWTEPRLMPCLEAYLERHYWKLLDRQNKGLWFVLDTSMMRPASGKWSHPDFTVVSVTPLQVLPSAVLDIYSFELKAENAGNLIAVHEALAQTRQTHYGILVWHLPPSSRCESRLPEVETGCEQHGIGLVLIRDPENTDTWEVRVPPVRKETNVADVDGFLAARLTSQQKQDVRMSLIGARQ